MIVMIDTMIAQINLSHLLINILRRKKTQNANRVNINGRKKEVKTLMIKSLDPKKFTLVSFKKQS